MRLQNRKILHVLSYYSKTYQSLVDSVMISAELDREGHDSISHNCDRERAGTT
jgi:hypothetical protein